MQTILMTLAGILVLTAMAGAAIGACQTAELGAGPTEKLDAQTSLMIYPVLLGERPAKGVADVIGLMLERQGMRNHDTTEAAFEPQGSESVEELAKQFGAFIRENPPGTDHAMCVEFVGLRESGPTEIRIVIVDKGGKTVWTDRQTPEDADFQRIKPRKPMTCCVLVNERLTSVLGIEGSISKPVEGGRFERLWEQDAGRPDKAERAAIEERLAAMKQAGASAAVLVYPVRVSGKMDPTGAEALAKVLSAEKLCTAKGGDARPEFDVKRHSNEQRMLWDFAREVREYVKAHAPDADYVLAADYYVGDDRAHAVHFVVCDSSGEWVIVEFQNEYQSEYKQIKPKTQADCDRLVATCMEQLLK